MNIFAQLNGITSAIATLEGIKAKSHAGQLKAIEQVSILLRDSAVQFVDAGHPDHPEVQTGDLRKSIRYVVQDGTPITAAVGTDIDYATPLEFGHTQQPGRFVPALGKQLVAGSVKPYPFMRPAMDEVIESGKAAAVYGDTIKTEVLG